MSGPALGVGFCLALSWGCGADTVVTLGQAVPTPFFGDAGVVIAGVNADSAEEDPTLTEDMLEIYFTSNRPIPTDPNTGAGDVWRATRLSRTEPFGEPEPVHAANSAATETSPAISPDGLTLWVGSARLPSQGLIDVWQLTRPNRRAEWGIAINVIELNSPDEDLPRPLAQRGTIMPLSSQRGGTGDYQTYLAFRDAAEASFYKVEEIPELALAGTSTMDGFLTEDGLFLFFKRAEIGGPGDLYMSWRRSRLESFSTPIALDSVNTEADERDPWVNSDSTRFFFASNRRTRTSFDIYATRLGLPRFE